MATISVFQRTALLLICSFFSASSAMAQLSSAVTHDFGVSGGGAIGGIRDQSEDNNGKYSLTSFGLEGNMRVKNTEPTPFYAMLTLGAQFAETQAIGSSSPEDPIQGFYNIDFVAAACLGANWPVSLCVTIAEMDFGKIHYTYAEDIAHFEGTALLSSMEAFSFKILSNIESFTGQIFFKSLWNTNPDIYIFYYGLQLGIQF